LIISDKGWQFEIQKTGFKEYVFNKIAKQDQFR
jgi:hypothetical protein